MLSKCQVMQGNRKNTLLLESKLQCGQHHQAPCHRCTYNWKELPTVIIQQGNMYA